MEFFDKNVYQFYRQDCQKVFMKLEQFSVSENLGQNDPRASFAEIKNIFKNLGSSNVQDKLKINPKFNSTNPKTQAMSPSATTLIPLVNVNTNYII